jgi:hypothetical protein
MTAIVAMDAACIDAAQLEQLLVLERNLLSFWCKWLLC